MVKINVEEPQIWQGKLLSLHELLADLCQPFSGEQPVSALGRRPVIGGHGGDLSPATASSEKNLELHIIKSISGDALVGESCS